MRRLAASLALATLAFGTPALAQEAPPPPPEKPHTADKIQKPDDPEKRKELHRRIMALRMARLTQELDLDEGTAAKLFPLVNRHDEKVSGLLEDRAKALKELAGAVHDDKNDAFGPLLDKIADCEKAIHEADETVHKKVRDVLTPRQMAQFLIFHEKFQEEVRGLLEDSKHEKAPRAPGEPDIEGMLHKAEACARDDRIDDALMILGKAIDIAPKEVAPHLMRAKLRMSRKDVDGAIADAKAAVELAPGKSDPVLFLAHLCLEKGDKDAAVQVLDDYLRKADGPGADDARKMLEKLKAK
jgi:Spy/CpxP family protein refolding chaperone